MSKLIVGTAEVDEVRHRANLSQKQLEQLVVEAVAKAAGVDLGQPGVSIRTCYLSSNMGSTSVEHSAVCEIVVDRRPQAKPILDEAA